MKIVYNLLKISTAFAYEEGPFETQIVATFLNYPTKEKLSCIIFTKIQDEILVDNLLDTLINNKELLIDFEWKYSKNTKYKLALNKGDTEEPLCVHYKILETILI